MADEEPIFSDEKKKRGVRTWKVVTVTALITFALMLIFQIVDSASSEEFKYVPIITPLFNFPPHIFKPGDGVQPAKDLPFEPESSFFTPLLQFIIMVTIFVALILLVIFK